MNIINVTVRGKMARAEERARVVCGNSDYTVRFDFDADWAEYTVKTARFVTEDGSYTDVQFEGEDCAIPILRNTRTLLVGVFAGNLRTTTAALIHAVPCITDPDGTPADPTPDVYAQLMERFNAMEAPAAVLYTAQELTDEQKAIARENISAMAAIKKVSTGTNIILEDNTEYRLEDVTSLTISYPDTEFECWVRLKFADAGDIAVTMPESKYIGSAPTFANGETWELSIKDGVVIAQKVGNGT